MTNRRSADKWWKNRAVVGWVILVLLAGLGNIQAIKASNDAEAAAQEAQTAAQVAAAITKQLVKFTEALRDANVTGCERQNEVRQALRSRITQDIHDTRHTDPSLFPQIPPDEFAQLLRKRIKRLREQRAGIPDAPCDKIYPKPRSHPVEGGNYS